MKAVERILLKLIIVQFVFLLMTQLFFHHMNAFPELKQLTQYEGVTDQNFTELLETFKEKY
ncbi:YpfB family protein [Bacillus sp. ISL-47]|uniref:YpfB family protein n=1 Tax=Bacillus sp. ISL-47 TaxID=2819130 RepID=UPI001BE94844|nr:YpfB family protein [Bacillus sp. ISL-47]MBT2689993.1 YpfB family protein [Bacillus sp. ISL-47]